MLHVALWQPEIPPNTGNTARLCAATGSTLHLVGRLGFRTDDRSLRRAGLDYWDHVEIRHHETFAQLEQVVGVESIWCIETPATRRYTEVLFQPGTCIVFGSESRGLPVEVRERYSERMVCIPMLTDKVRSLNLANAASVVVYEALRQLHGW